MIRSPILRATFALALGVAVLPTPGGAQPRPPALPFPSLPSLPPTGLGDPNTVRRASTAAVQQPAVNPKFEVVAETPLLMEGLIHSNYRSLQKILKEKPADRETWVFARGQAILIAEAGNLLLLRPAKGTGRDPWWKLSMELRSRATTLARAAAARDHNRSVSALSDLTDTCKRCHQTFRVNIRLDPTKPPVEGDAE